MKPPLKISAKTWESQGLDGTRTPHRAVVLLDENGDTYEDEGYAVSPDGHGAYYFDTLAELLDNYADFD